MADLVKYNNTNVGSNDVTVNANNFECMQTKQVEIVTVTITTWVVASMVIA